MRLALPPQVTASSAIFQTGAQLQYIVNQIFMSNKNELKFIFITHLTSKSAVLISLFLPPWLSHGFSAPRPGTDNAF
jgi:hypothetical protein